MSTSSAMGGSTPRRPVGGDIRLGLERARLYFALAPVVFWALIITAVLLACIVLVGGLLGLALIVGVLTLVGIEWRRWVRLVGAVVWRLEWRWAARSSGLAMITEKDIDIRHDPGDEHVEAVPALVNLHVGRTGSRRYEVRPLPGQQLADFEKAANILALRWRCETVTIERATGSFGRGRVVLTSIPGGAIDRQFTLDGASRDHARALRLADFLRYTSLVDHRQHARPSPLAGVPVGQRVVARALRSAANPRAARLIWPVNIGCLVGIVLCVRYLAGVL